MVNYRRNWKPGGTYFFTVALFNRRQKLLTDHIDCLRHAWRFVRQHIPQTIIAVVVLTEHLHVVIEMPQGDARYSKIWFHLKREFTRALRAKKITIGVRKSGDSTIWQRRYWEHTIRDERDLGAHIDYIHFNPVKYGLVRSVSEWPYSSFHRYVRDGLLPENWASESLLLTNANTTFGE
jgi:putative transposase